MEAYKTVELIKTYGACHKCGNELLGEGQGKLIVEEDTFYRSCKCGWSIKLNSDGEELNCNKKKGLDKWKIK